MNNVEKLKRFIKTLIVYDRYDDECYVYSELSLAELKTLRELVGYAIWQRLEEYSPAVFAEGANVKTEGVWND